MARIPLIVFLVSASIGCSSIRPQDIEGPIAVYDSSTAEWRSAGVFRPAERRPVIVMKGEKIRTLAGCERTDHTRRLYVQLEDGSLRLKVGRLLRCAREDAIEI